MAKVVTFGCRLNTYESQVIKDLVDEENVIIFNTCGVTKKASKQARQAIRKARKENPDARIVVTGCDAQIDPSKYADMQEVDQIIGNEHKFDRESYQKTDRIFVSDIMKVKEMTPHLVASFDGKVRAFIEIQNGCNHRCTFCTIPYGRGRSRSAPLQMIVNQIKLLMENGYKEFVLTGVDITHYGFDLPGRPRLGQTIKRLFNLLPDLKRLRLSSLDPSEMDEELWNLIKTDPRLLPHFHLSLQAGDDTILKRMARRHLRSHVFEFLEFVKQHRPMATIGADIIVGFPTETDEMFEHSVGLYEQLDMLHVFPFSAHENTPAFKMPQVDSRVIKERAKIMQGVRQDCMDRLLKRWVGKTDNVLIERIQNDVAYGKTDHFMAVKFKATDGMKVGDVLIYRH
ncbi:MAG: tRNA (N(6)-L-threonylcarbamoyladenosine(37)-C(2))-methylthiotransferase MtaB [Alphaproteobacteria bacterium]|nr:MAG: tRNA (N(6)-L-threonylcarbamoyladenosine(37)-C(2))-methylthiotransferase MtaB [Alphaproteobacteria bacterium]